MKYLMGIMVMILMGGAFVLALENPDGVNTASMMGENPDLPEFQVTEFEQSLDGRIIFDMVDFRERGLHDRGNYALEIERSGGVLWSERYETVGHFPKRHTDGVLTFYEVGSEHRDAQANPNYWFFHDGGDFEVRQGGGYRALNPIPNPLAGEILDFHDLILLPNANWLMMTTDIRPMYEDSEITCLPPPLCGVVGQNIIEVQNDEIVWEFSLLDHYTRDDFVMDDMLIQEDHILYDVTHANSMDVDTEGNILVSVRHTDELVLIDRANNDIVWRLGGHHSDFEFVDDPLGGFSHQHTGTFTGDDIVMVFDNGNGHNPPVSRIAEYALDYDEMTATLIFEWYTPERHFAPTRGSAERLPNGNTLASFVMDGVYEVNPQGDIIYRIELPQGYASYRAQFWADSFG